MSKDFEALKKGKHAYSAISGLLLLGLIMGCTAPATKSQQDHAYLIIKATARQQTQDQPTWILLCRGKGSSRCDHYDASGRILRLDSGWYSIGHIDFAETWHRSEGDRFLDSEGFWLEPGIIYFFGHIQFDRLRGIWTKRKHQWKIVMDPELVRDACASDPEIFEKYPAVNIHIGEKVKLSCNSDDE